MIKVRNLVAKYGDYVVLNDVSLEVNPQEVMVIMGQSGCGKTTFLRHLIGTDRELEHSSLSADRRPSSWCERQVQAVAS